MIRMLQNDGWSQESQRGSHRHFTHPTKPGKVTVAGQMSEDVAPKTLRSILRQAGPGGSR